MSALATAAVALPLAHVGHWLWVFYVIPILIVIAGIIRSTYREKKRERMRRSVPLGEFGEPEDVAYGILYLISDESRFVTGTDLVIDGGMNAI